METKNIRANRYAREYINGIRFLTKNVCVIAFCTKEVLEFGGIENEILGFEDAYLFAKQHNARFSLFVLELIKRHKNSALNKKDRTVRPKKSMNCN